MESLFRNVTGIVIENFTFPSVLTLFYSWFVINKTNHQIFSVTSPKGFISMSRIQNENVEDILTTILKMACMDLRVKLNVKI